MYFAFIYPTYVTVFNLKLNDKILWILPVNLDVLLSLFSLLQYHILFCAEITLPL